MVFIRNLFSGILRRTICNTVAAVFVLPNKFSMKLNEQADIMDLKTPEPVV